MEKRNHYAVDDLYQFSLNVLEAAGYNEAKARSTAYALLEADKRGIFSHGTAGGTGIEESVKRSGITATVRLDTEPTLLEQKYPTIAIIDAKGSPGHYSSDIAVELVKKLAREYGYGKVIVNNANHYGAAGVWSHKISENGDLKGISTCTTVAVARVLGDDPDRLDYTKGAGKENRLGTNPLAISIPYQNGILTFDTAWTRMAVSYCLKQLKSGEMMSIPEYIADQNYKSTLDPKGFADSMETLSQGKGTVFPHGSTLAGYKGDSMLRFIEIDNALGGGPIEKIPIGIKDERRRISHTFEAQALDVLYTVDEAKKRVKNLMQDYESKYFGINSRWPGDRAQEALEYSIREGIPYNKGQIESLQRTADYVKIEFSLKRISFKLYPSSIFNK
ncbi:MAG: Ldh family oxidoreductase [Candidatus Hodarchaeales archaeon]|jgi:L-2-hydroxycarboxylate dehydrogenase (NAD+)